MSAETIKLPQPNRDGNVSVEKALSERRSVREYEDEPLTLAELSQLLWAAQGITDSDGHRTAPSAGATYPLELYIVSGNVTGLPAGVYKYRPQEHELVQTMAGDVKSKMHRRENDTLIEGGAVIIVFAVVYERTTSKYEERGIRYVHIDVGHAAQNIYLQAAAYGLGTVAVGSFDDDKIKQTLQLPDEEQVLYLMPVGWK